MLAQVSHVHDLPEAATLLDPQTQVILRAALREMWDSETQLRMGQPQAALPFANKALRLIKQVQQADRIYLPRMGSELPPIDFTRRMSGKRDDLAARSNAFVAIPDESMPLDALWRALGADREGSQVPKESLDDAARWMQARAGDERDTLAAIAALDALREEPGCDTCRDELRLRVWPLLAKPLPKPAPRPRATAGRQCVPGCTATRGSPMITIESIIDLLPWLLAIGVLLASVRLLVGLLRLPANRTSPQLANGIVAARPRCIGCIAVPAAADIRARRQHPHPAPADRTCARHIRANASHRRALAAPAGGHVARGYRRRA